MREMTLPGRGAALIAMGLLVATLWTSTAAHAAPHTAAPASLHAAPRAAPHPFTLTSRVFHDGGALPSNAALNTDGCNGANRLPTLAWTGVPTGTQSFALLIVDPDAAPAIPSGWVHGNVYNIPPAVRILTARSLGRYTSGTTSFSDTGLSPSTTYVYEVTASNAAGTSGNSGTARITTCGARKLAHDALECLGVDVDPLVRVGDPVEGRVLAAARLNPAERIDDVVAHVAVGVSQSER